MSLNSSPTMLQINHLCHQFGDVPIFEQLNLRVGQGEFLSILGPSGCGKTTLLRSIAGLNNPTQGSIIINNKIVGDAGRIIVPTEQREVGYVLQEYALFPHLSVAENIAFGLYTKSVWPKQKRHQRVAELLSMINMLAYADHMPSELSGGQQQRVALARALAAKPKLLLLDEPFANIDVTLRQALGTELQRIVQHENVTVILVTHDYHEAFALANRVAVLTTHPQQNYAASLGTTIMQCDTPNQVYHYPSNIHVAQLTGAVSILPAQGKGPVAICAWGQEIPLKQPHQGSGTLILRPENVNFIPKADGPFCIISRLFRGYCYRLLCEEDSGIQVYADVAIEHNHLTLGSRGTLDFTANGWMV